MFSHPFYCLPFYQTAFNPYLQPNYSYPPFFFENLNAYRHRSPSEISPKQAQNFTIIPVRPETQEIRPLLEQKQISKVQLNQHSIFRAQRNFSAKSKKFSSKIAHQAKIKNQEQKDGRNANSNLLRLFFRRLQFKLQNCPETFDIVLQKYQLAITVEDFHSWIEENDIDYRNYIRVSSIRRLFIGNQNSLEQAKMMRILLKEFLQSQVFVCYLTSKKAKRGVMNYNLRSIRNILEDILRNHDDDSN